MWILVASLWFQALGLFILYNDIMQDNTHNKNVWKYKLVPLAKKVLHICKSTLLLNILSNHFMLLYIVLTFLTLRFVYNSLNIY